MYGKAVANVPTPEKSNWVMFYYRGICHERSHQWPLAEADLKKALELFPDQPLVLNYLCLLYTSRRDCLADARHQPGAPARHQGAFSRSHSRSAAHVRAAGARAAAAFADRLGRDPAGERAYGPLIRHPEVAAKRPSKDERPGRDGRRASRLATLAPQGDGIF